MFCLYFTVIDPSSLDPWLDTSMKSGEQFAKNSGHIICKFGFSSHWKWFLLSSQFPSSSVVLLCWLNASCEPKKTFRFVHDIKYYVAKHNGFIAWTLILCRSRLSLCFVEVKRCQKKWNWTIFHHFMFSFQELLCRLHWGNKLKSNVLMRAFRGICAFDFD